MSMRLPLISCLCITKNKTDFLKKAIGCFKNQTYERKELIIVLEDDNPQKEKILKERANDSSIKVIEVKKSSKKSLGQLRNLAIRAANGEYICQWDDDDWYHIGRLEYQYTLLKKANYPGCILTRWMLYDLTLQKAYISGVHLWEGSIMCKKSILFKKKYEHKNQGEDTKLIFNLYNKKLLFPINNLHQLYIYVFHGKNTWQRPHWKYLFDSGQLLPDNVSHRIKKMLNDKSFLKSSIELDKIFNNPLFNY